MLLLLRFFTQITRWAPRCIIHNVICEIIFKTGQWSVILVDGNKRKASNSISDSISQEIETPNFIQIHSHPHLLHRQKSIAYIKLLWEIHGVWLQWVTSFHGIKTGLGESTIKWWRKSETLLLWKEVPVAFVYLCLIISILSGCQTWSLKDHPIISLKPQDIGNIQAERFHTQSESTFLTDYCSTNHLKGIKKSLKCLRHKSTA